jgi:uncharacterized protein (DUF433 family)
MKEAVEAIMTVDWSECDLVESVAGKVGGRPVVKGTRIPADTILADEELGATAEETQESFPSLSFDTIRSIRAYGHSHKRTCPINCGLICRTLTCPRRCMPDTVSPNLINFVVT